MSTHRSVVKWFDAKKGYGFIVHPDGENDIFVHYSAIDTERRFKTLRTGQVVEFELSDGPKGLHASNVVPTEEMDEFSDDAETYEPADREEPSYQGDSPAAGPYRTTY